jgi:hypothetical protein
MVYWRLSNQSPNLFSEVSMPKKSGAPMGNKNAQKHGMYSRAYTRDEQRELSQTVLDYRQNNIKFFKVIIARTAERIKPSASNPMPFQEIVTVLNTLVIAISRLHSAQNLKHQMLTDREMDMENDIVKFCQRIGMTKEEIDRELFGIVPIHKSGNKRGGQVGNLNALKHGFFASAYSLEELRKLEDVNEQDAAEEIALLLFLMKRVLIGMKKDIPPADYLRAVRVLSAADACLEKLKHTRGLSVSPSAALNRAIDEVLKLDPYDDSDASED